MESLMTRIPESRIAPPIRYRDAMLLLGSCFTEHIGGKLERYKYDVNINPFGIMYNPVSMANALERIADARYYSGEELMSHNDVCHSLDHHGFYSGKKADAVLENINQSIGRAHAFMKHCAFYFLSPGTANVFVNTTTTQIVANCHKIPQDQFHRRRLSVVECQDAFDRMVAAIQRMNPNATIIWTLSPVRHLRDGLIENQRSKASLLLAMDALGKNNPDTGYFPVYEIMMDELRDYRFYARDMAHPSDVAIDLIWERFSDAYLDPREREHHPAIEKIKRAMEHRFLHDDREGIKKFAAIQLKQIEVVASLLPDRQWQLERQYFFHLLEED